MTPLAPTAPKRFAVSVTAISLRETAYWARLCSTYSLFEKIFMGGFTECYLKQQALIPILLK